VIRVTLDSNEFISAFNFGGKALDLIRQAVDGEIEIAISQPIIDETIRVLRERFEWQPYRLHFLRERLLNTCVIVEPSEGISLLGDGPDNRILECAKESGSMYIITEDRVMLRLKEYEGVKIVRAFDFVGRRRGGI
jgi:uncharacterized protein